jgi:FAD/FMN-containing dehydrogenase
LVGSEGTLAFITEITVGLDPLPPKEIMVVCGHCDALEKSFEGNLVALKHQPTAIELMDGDILQLSKGNAEQLKNRFFVDGDPAALLITELRAETREELDRQAEALEHDLIESGLIYKCTRVYGSDVAKVWNCSLPTVSQKLNGLRPLFLDEAVSLANLLDLTDQEKVDIFFADQIA